MNSSSLSSSSLLLTLYASVLVPVYSEWISKEDLCLLDTAVCSQELRNVFLEMLTFCSITNLVSDEDSSFSWMIVRGLRVRKLQVDCITPVSAALIESGNVRELIIIDLYTLADHMHRSQTSVMKVTVDGLWGFDASEFKIVGSAIDGLSNFKGNDESVRAIAACCPNLKRITASHTSPLLDAYEAFLLPLVDACQLDEINGCHLGSLVKREKCEWTYRCNLKRTSEVNDETAVCLGEGKYYHMTSLNCWYKMTEKDSDLLIRLMSHLTDLSTTNGLGCNILSAAVEKCRNLRSLYVASEVDLSKLKQLLLKSHDLRELNVILDRFFSYADECLAVIPESCPLLEVCTLKGCYVQSESVMSALFSKCRFLVDFCARNWPVDSVLPFAMNVEELKLGDWMCAYKSGRAQRSLNIPNIVSMGVLCAILVQNPGLKSVEISHRRNDISCVVASMVQCCPQLTSIILSSVREVDSLSSLSRLMHLTSLSMWSSTGFTIETLSAVLENKSSSLRSLTLSDCRISSDMLAVISRLCPALTSLRLSNNPDIENADLMKLLNCCSKLEVLSLRGCSRITSEIVSSIKSPPMKSLDVYGSGINRSDLADAFDDVEGFVLSW